MSNNETGRRNIVVIVVALVLALAMIVGTAIWVKLHNSPPKEVVTTTTTETTTEATKYNVDLAYIQRMLDEERFTDSFEDYTPSSFPSSSTASKEAYWKGIQNDKTVNPLLLAATSSYLSDLGFDTPDVRPSELYTEDGALNKQGEETLEAVQKVIFSNDTKVYTIDLGKEASKYYNSTPSNDDGIVYAQKIGVTGNKACWVISTKSVDSQFDDIMKDSTKSSSGSSSSKDAKSDGSSKATTEKTVIQLCRCGNTVDKTPKKPTPRPTTTKPATTRQQTTKQQTTRQTTTKPNITIPSVTIPDITIPSITVPTTQPTTKQTTQPTTRQTTTQPTTTTRPSTTKNPEKDPVNQGNANRGGGKNDPTEKATSAYQPEKPSKQTTVKTVEETTTKPTTTTKPATTKQATTRPATTNPTTQPPTATPTQKPSSEYKDPDTGKTTVITPDDTFSGRPVLPD